MKFDMDELIDLITACSVTPHEIAEATNNMLSRRHISRCITDKNPPKHPLHRLVLTDILAALKWAYATNTLPITDYGLTNGVDGGRHKKFVAATHAITEALAHAQRINSGADR